VINNHSNQIFLFVIAAFVFGPLLLALSLIVQKLFLVQQKKSLISQEGYECGVKQLGKSSVQFDVKYYSFALLFIIFDIEFVFILPWVLYFSKNSLGLALDLTLLLEAFVFVLILSLGLLYVWKKKNLEWD